MGDGCFVTNNAPLPPPKPEIILMKACFSVASLAVVTFIFPDTPYSSNPRVHNTVWSSIAAIDMTVSKMPAAPNVCPRYPFRALTEMSDRPARSMATDSIWSLNIVAVPCALMNAICSLFSVA